MYMKGEHEFEPKLSAQEVAKIFAVSHVTIGRWVRTRKFPHYKTIGGQYRFLASEMHAFLTEHGLDIPPELIVLARVRRKVAYAG